MLRPSRYGNGNEVRMGREIIDLPSNCHAEDLLIGNNEVRMKSMD